MCNKIQVVSFQMPFPADYGGVIDVYYKLKALHDSGVYVILHTFIYGREASDKIKDAVDEVYFYPRNKSILANISFSPFIVKTRENKDLLERLINIGAPVLLEGLHTCSLLKPLHDKGLKVAVRAHNIEHDYYYALSKATVNPLKKLFYKIEAKRLKKFESNLEAAEVIFAISSQEKRYFENKFRNTKVELLYPFFNDSDLLDYNLDEEKKESVDVLYHGNLKVVENQAGLKYIVDEILPHINESITLTVAGKCSSEHFIKYLNKKGVIFYNNPSDSELDYLIHVAKINLLISFQSTGIKLKLLNTLSKSEGVSIVNSNMVPDESLRRFCIVAETPVEIAEYINKLISNPNFLQEKKKQRVDFTRCFNNYNGVRILNDFLQKT